MFAPTTKTAPWVAPLIVAAAVAWGVFVHWTAPVLPFDDAFITYRYVENVVAGKGLVYNAGQRVLGVSTPLYLLLLAGLKWLLPSASVPVLAIRMNGAALAVAGVLLYLLLRRWSGRQLFAAAASSLLLVEPLLLSWSVGGMESTVFLVLLFAAALAAASGRPVWFGVCAGLACLTRPEGLLLLPVGLLAFARDRKGLVRATFAGAAVVAPWLVFALSYYGSVVPLSITAKARPLYPLPAGVALSELVLALEGWATGGEVPWLVQLRTVLVLSLALAAACATFAVRELRQRGAWIPALLFCGFVLLYALGNPMLFEWYFPAPFLCAGLAFAAGGPALGRLAAARFPRRAVPVASALVLLGLVPMTALRYAQGLTPARIVEGNPARLRVRAYREAAETLNREASESSVLASPEVGSLGYYFKGRMLDACGLVSPEALPFLPVPLDQRYAPNVGAISAELVRRMRPDYVATLEIFSAYSLRRSDWFKTSYVSIGSVPLPQPCWRSEKVLLYRSKG